MTSRSAPLALRSASAAVFTILLTAGGLAVLAGRRRLLDAVRASGPDSPADLLVVAAASVSAAVLLWLGLGVTLAALAAVPDRSAGSPRQRPNTSPPAWSGGSLPPCSVPPWPPWPPPWLTRAVRSQRRPSRRRPARPRPAGGRPGLRRHGAPTGGRSRARPGPVDACRRSGSGVRRRIDDHPPPRFRRPRSPGRRKPRRVRRCWDPSARRRIPLRRAADPRRSPCSAVTASGSSRTGSSGPTRPPSRSPVSGHAGTP